MPRVSVLIPCHNAAPWLRAAVVSMLRQTHTDLEILVLDDGSTDGSAESLERIAAHNPRVKVFYSEANGGIVSALTSLLSHAQGDYIARMDADDISHPDRIRLQLQHMNENSLDLCGSWFVEFGQGIPRSVRWPVEPESINAALLFQNPICHPTVLARRDVLEQNQYRKSRELSEDYDLFSRLSRSYRLGNCPALLLRYRRHLGQATQFHRARMEEVARLIRLEALVAQGFKPSEEELHLHNLIRRPHSILKIEDLVGIETWLLKLHAAYHSSSARRVIASQWVRACIRAAPLKGGMWRRFRSSPLREYAGAHSKVDLDLFLLSIAGLDYAGSAFRVLRRFGLSA